MPPVPVALNERVPPAHSVAGDEVTVSVGVAITVMSNICQLDEPLILYEMCAVPADRPVILPSLTVATAVLLLVQLPAVGG